MGVLIDFFLCHLPSFLFPKGAAIILIKLENSENMYLEGIDIKPFCTFLRVGNLSSNFQVFVKNKQSIENVIVFCYITEDKIKADSY